MTNYFDFEKTPPLGTRVKYTHGRVFTLSRVGKYFRRDGTESVLLEWVGPDGEVGTSGLRGKGLYWRTIEEAQAARFDLAAQEAAR